jgi:hypothetical protein
MRRFLLTIAVSAAILMAGALVTDRVGFNPFKGMGPQIDFVRLV